MTVCTIDPTGCLMIAEALDAMHVDTRAAILNRAYLAGAFRGMAHAGGAICSDLTTAEAQLPMFKSTRTQR